MFDLIRLLNIFVFVNHYGSSCRSYLHLWLLPYFLKRLAKFLFSKSSFTLYHKFYYSLCRLLLLPLHSVFQLFNYRHYWSPLPSILFTKTLMMSINCWFLFVCYDRFFTVCFYSLFRLDYVFMLLFHLLISFHDSLTIWLRLWCEFFEFLITLFQKINLNRQQFPGFNCTGFESFFLNIADW